jgi:predicted nucleotidyltransferase
MEPTALIIDNQCSIEKIDGIFWPIIEDAIAAYQSIFADAVLNIRLLGSVARGEAGRHSDIDFITVLNMSPSAEQMRKVEQEEGNLSQKHSFISKVDLEAVPGEDLNEFRQFVFAIDSVSLFGSDIYTSQSQTVDRQKLVEMVTPDLAEIVKSYRSAVQNTDEGNEHLLFFYSRLIGKDILKCFRRVSLLSGGEYERSIDRIYHQLLQYTPERRELLHELFDLYTDPSSDRQRLLTALQDV